MLNKLRQYLFGHTQSESTDAQASVMDQRSNGSSPSQSVSDRASFPPTEEDPTNDSLSHRHSLGEFAEPSEVKTTVNNRIQSNIKSLSKSGSVQSLELKF